MKQVRVAGGQIPVTMDIAANVAAIERAIDFAIQEEADILVTPEGSLSGYDPVFDYEAAERALQRVTARAREGKLGLALGTCWKEPDGQTYNQIRFYGKDGAYLGFHSKILLGCAIPRTNPPSGEMTKFATTPLRTFVFEGIVVGGLICNDVFATPQGTVIPDTHLGNQLGEMGARVIFHAVNAGRGSFEWRDLMWKYHEIRIRLLARGASAWIVSVDNAHPAELRTGSPAMVVDPQGNVMCRAEQCGERYFAYTIEV